MAGRFFVSMMKGIVVTVLNQGGIERFRQAVGAMPLIAVLRGIRPDEAAALGKVLYDEGFRLIEVPLNSPEPFESIAQIRKALPADAVVGAGTVLAPDQVVSLKACGGDIVFMPHSDLEVVRAAKREGLLCVPGVATPTEAFAALAAGADALKLFPAEMIVPKIVKSIGVVLPKGTCLVPFGGITPDNMGPYIEAGASAFGLGSALYKPGMRADELADRARAFVAAVRRDWKGR